MSMIEFGRISSYKYEFVGQRFQMPLDFSPQYFHLYRIRLDELINRSVESATRKSKTRVFNSLIESKSHTYGVVSGIIVRYHKNKPSTIQKYVAIVGSLESRPSNFGNY